MNEQSLLDRVKVAKPCNARWENMSGDDRVRFCRHCEKHVFDLSALSRPEAEALIREKEGKLCGRFYRRRDGRMLTTDCPLGRRRHQQRLARWCGLLMATLAVGFIGRRALDSVGEERGSGNGFVQSLHNAWYQARVKLGIIQPTPMVMGMICVPPPRTPAIPPGNATSQPASKE